MSSITGQPRSASVTATQPLEVLCFADVPERSALWHHRCPSIPDFTGDLAPILAHVVTDHWFDPCELLGDDARSELRAEHRQRQHGGGWQQLAASACRSRDQAP